MQQYQVAAYIYNNDNGIIKSESHVWTSSEPKALHAMFVALHARLCALPSGAHVSAHMSIYNDGECVSRVDLSGIALAHPR
jgi:hypothetical protein